MSTRAFRRLVVAGVVLAGLGHVRLATHAGGGTDAAPPQSATASTEGASVDPERLMDVVRELSAPEHGGRRTGSEGIARSRAYLVDRFRSAGLEPVGDGYVRPFSFTSPWRRGPGPPGRAERAEALDGTNLVGACPGREPDAPVLLVSAHYDHLGVRDGLLYPGADDNASGVAVLLAVAETCRRLKRRHTLLVVAFDAEELGLAGAKAFLADPPVPLERIVAMVNLDMLGRNQRREVFAAGTTPYPHLRAPLERVRDRARVVLRFGHDTPKRGANRRDDWTYASDHGPFHDAGVPFVYFGVEDHADYHQPTDTADAIDPRFLADVAAMVIDAVDELDRTLTWPRSPK